MGVPLLFTGQGGITVVPYPGLFLDDETYLGEELYLDEALTEFVATTPALPIDAVVVTVDPVAVAFTATAPTVAADFVVSVDPVAVVFTATAPSLAGTTVTVPVDPVPVAFEMPVPDSSGGLLLIVVPSVRELPPLRISHLIETPSGRFFRWGSDEPDPANVPSGERFSDTMPGGFETSDATLPRKVGQDAPDLERFSTWNIHGAGGEIVWQGRLERAPRTSGDQVSVSPSGVGFQAALDDDKSATVIYIDRDLSQWQGPSVARRAATAPVAAMGDSDVMNDSTTPGLRLNFSGPWTQAQGMRAEALYMAPAGANVAGVFTRFFASASTGQGSDGNWFGNFWSAATDNSFFSPTPTYLTTAFADVQYGFVPPRRGILAQLGYLLGPAGTDGVDYSVVLTSLQVFGDHGLPLRGSLPNFGYLASDIVTHAVRRWAPQLNVSATSVQASGFVIPHAAFREPTTAAEIVKSISRFGFQDWAVWSEAGKPTFYWHDRGVNSRHWRARVGPAQLEETGQTADRIYESVMVQYQDVDGSTRMVGPPGSGADSEAAGLKDLDPENPANRASITRRALLTMGTSTAAAAGEIGRRFLEEQKQLDGSGRARLVGHVESDRGVTFPYHAVRSGDVITFIDASDTSPRRVIRADKDHGSRTCSVDLDAPPEGLQALLERLGVVLVPLGFN